jgi:hypothetical protein
VFRTSASLGRQEIQGLGGLLLHLDQICEMTITATLPIEIILRLRSWKSLAAD